jgi:hypothetical protein
MPYISNDMPTKTNVYSLSYGGATVFQDPAGTPSVPAQTGVSPTVSDKLEYMNLMEDNNPLSVHYKPVHHELFEHFALCSTEDYYSSIGNPTHRGWVGPNVYWMGWGGLQPPQLTSYQMEQRLAFSYPYSDSWLINEAKQNFMNLNVVDTMLNVIEAPELPNSIVDITKKVSKIECVYQKTRNAPKVTKRLGDLLKLGSGGFLSYSFGLAPLISDIKKVTKMAPKLKSGLSRAQKDAGAIVSSHHAMYGNVALKPGSASPYSFDAYRYHQDELLVLGKPLKVATVRGINSHTYDGELFNKAQYLLQRVGSSGPATLAWERIPFSFVFDWFVDTRNVLNTLDNLLTGGQKNILAMGISEKYHVQLNQRHINVPGITYTNHTHGGVVVSGTRLRSYRRTLASGGFPVVLKDASGFGKNRVGIAAALMTQLLSKS